MIGAGATGWAMVAGVEGFVFVGVGVDVLFVDVEVQIVVVGVIFVVVDDERGF